MIAAGFSWFNAIAAIDSDPIGAAIGGTEYNFTVLFLSGVLTTVLIGVVSVAGRIALQKAMARPEGVRFQADEKLTLFGAIDMFGGFIHGMMADAMPRHEIKHYAPFIATLFLYILLCNLQGVVPGFLPPTDNINANMGMAIASFIVFMWVGLSRDPVGFLKHLAGPSLVLAPFLFTLESLSLVLRPLTLSVRLTGNMFGDHQVFSILSGLVPILVPAVLLGLATFVSLIQAFVFSLLSSVYIGLSLPHEHHDDHGQGDTEPAH